MKKVKIEVVKTMFNQDMADAYAAPAYATPDVGMCDMHKVGDVYYSNGWQKPAGLCDNAWKCIQEYVMTLAHGGKAFYNDWMKDEKTAVLACNDGIRPIIMKVSATDEDAEVFE